MHSRMEVSTAYHCNVSQLTKALTGVEYHSGPHHYKPKPRELCKRTTDQGEAQDAPQPKKTRAAPSKKTSTESQPWQAEHPTTFSLQKTDNISKRQKTLWNHNPAVTVHFQKACQHNVKMNGPITRKRVRPF